MLPSSRGVVQTILGLPVKSDYLCFGPANATMRKIIFIVALMFSFFGAAAQTVYSSEKGEKYHTGDCRLSGDATPVALAEATKKKKTACNVCKPDVWLKQSLSQCTGKTKDGKQCRRMTANKNKKCFQHGT